MNIILTGYRCSGKTSVGRELAKQTGRKLFDTDELIVERAGRTIEEIVAEEGWGCFRALERKAVKEVSQDDDLVIATGGGVVMDEANVVNLKKCGFIVWLNGDASVLRARMNNDEITDQQRPSLTGENPLDEIKKMLGIRNPLYKQASDMEIDTGSKSVKEIVDIIINEVSKNILDQNRNARIFH